MKSFAKQIIEHGMDAAGDCIAIVDKDATRKTTWKELRAWAEAVAAFAKAGGMRGIVPVRMERSAEAAATMLGLNLAGLGVAPIAVDTPVTRLRTIEELTGNKAWSAVDFTRAIETPSIVAAPAAQAGSQVAASSGECEDVAYVVFTSGSTGKPKGVMLSNDVVMRSISRMAGKDFFDFRRGEIALQCASISFIAFAADMLGALYAGCIVHVLSNEARKDPELFAAYVRDHGVNAAIITPQLLARIGELSPTLRMVITGSDRVSGVGPRGYRLVNAYGMSECGGWGSAFPILHPYDSTPIGTFTSAFREYIVDEDGMLADEGELCLSGAIASGYLGMPEETSAAFVPNPYSSEPGHEILFHTGDMVRRRDESSMFFLGRKDFMIKINGQRVEPGEAETALLRMDGIENAAVKGFVEPGAASYLCAYYVAEEDLDPAFLRGELEAVLPAYMIPSFFIRLPALPLNENGKINYKALEPPIAWAGKGVGVRAVPHRGDVEESVGEAEAAICRAFEEVLGVEGVSPNDDFLLIGGNSLLAMDVVAHLAGLDEPFAFAESVGLAWSDIRPSDILAARTPRGIVERVERRAAERCVPEPCADEGAGEVADEGAVDGAAETADFDDRAERIVAADASCSGRIDRVPLTDSQMGIYLPCALQPDVALYNNRFVLTIPRDVRATCDTVREAIHAVFAAHPALLARIETEEDGVYMVRQPLSPDGIAVAEEGDEARFEELCAQAAVPFALEEGPLCRAHAVLADTQIHVLFDIHHIVSDGTSVAIICRQLATCLAEGRQPTEAIDAFELYGMERSARSAHVRAADDEYFATLLAGEEIDSNLLPDIDSDAHEDGKHEDTEEERAAHCGHLEFSMNIPGLVGALREAGITESSAFMGAFGYALAKMTGQAEALFAAVSSGRHDARLAETVGMFVRTLPFVLHIDESMPVRAYLQEVQNQAFRTFEHDTASFGELCREYGISSDVMFVYQGGMFGGCDCASGHVECRALASDVAIANLSAQVLKGEKRPSGPIGGLTDESPDENPAFTVVVEYRSDLYRASTIERFMHIYEQMLQSIVSNASLSSVPLLTEGDCVALDGWNQTSEPYDASTTVVDIFRARAAEQPEKVCVVSKGSSYSYVEVDEMSDSIAASVRAAGIARGDAVPVLIPRNEYMVIASLGVLKAGAMYQPLDPSYPPERLAFMCEDSQARLLIADRELMQLVPDFEGSVLFTDEIAALSKVTEAVRADLADVAPRPDDGCVLLYTSGTTGTPKGCIIMHGNLRCFAHGQVSYAKMTPRSVASVYASYGFDAHMGDIYPAITVGGSVHIIPEEMRLDLPALHDYCVSAGFTHMIITTQVGRQFAMAFPRIEAMECLTVGGETLVPFEPECTYRFVNAYGPSECTVAASAFDVDCLYGKVPIGQALPNNRLYVVDACGRRVPVGAPGELVICGPQVARGYLNREEKTREVFVPNTFEAHTAAPYDRCYRTGDIVRFLNDGVLEFIGRRDAQVKVRGFRIELPEVEHVIRDYPGIADATVVARDDATGKCIHAYVVSEDSIDIDALNQFIRERKPPYMVPAATLQIDAIPYTPNMKVDKRKLPPMPAVGAQVLDGEDASGQTSRAMTALEEELVALVSEVVAVPNVGVETDLALVGLTSVTSIKLSVALYNRYGLRIASSELLDGCTILRLENALVAQLLESAQEANEEHDRESVRGAKASKESAALQRSAARCPLTQVQMGIYLDCLRTGNAAYNIPLLLKLPRSIDEDRFDRALEVAVRSHPSMFVHIYAADDGDVYQYPVPDMPIPIEHVSIDGTNMPPEPTVFEFGAAPLFRIRLIRSEEERFLFIEAHHIIFDGASMAILIDDIDRAYRGATPEREVYTAFDVAADEQENRTEAALAEARQAYAGIFKGVADDYRPCADASGDTRLATSDHVAELDSAATAAACARLHVTENVFFIGVFALALARFTAHEDALFTTIHNGRTDPRTARMASMLVRTVPLYIQTGNERAVDDYLQSIADLLLTLKRNDAYSFADAARDFGLNADVMFIYQGSIMQAPQIDGEVLEQVAFDSDQPKAQMSVEVFRADEGFRLHAEYNAGRYSEAFIATFADAFATCARGMLTADTLDQIGLCSDAALARFDAFNDTAWDVPYRPAYRLLEDSARIAPDRLAVVSGDEHLTYRQLDCMANRLAHTLLDAGIASGSVIEVIAPRCTGVYVAQNGILKAGSAFLFLSPDYPDERIAFVSDDAQAAAIVTTRAIAEERAALFAGIGSPLFYIDDIPTDAADESPSLEIGPDEPVYLIYTSGTTGKPKGIVVRQRGLANLVDLNPINEQIACYTQDSPVIAAVAAFTFDASVFEEFIALAHAMTIAIAGDEEIHNPMAFTKFCLEQGVTTITSTASFYLSCLDYPGFADAAAKLKCIVQGGEAFPPVLYEEFRRLNPALRIVNSYGPSETTVSCSAKVLDSPEHITIGTPVANTKIYMIDKQIHILPMGALGEMVVLGDGVGLGYLNRPELTEHAFVEMQGLPAYRTGDLAIITHAGEIEFHGRADDQVKLRGLRVELGEIEHAIETCEGVTRAVVTVHGDERSRFLAAYFTADRRIDSKDIVAQISRTLAAYMVPSVFIQIESMPLTANGKVDKRALPEPQITAQDREYVEPATDVERMFCDAFGDILGVERVGATDDFFSLGGTSLTASKLAMFAMSHGLEIVYADIFEHPTPRGLAVLADGAQSDAVQVSHEMGQHAAASKNADSALSDGESPTASVPLPNSLPPSISGASIDFAEGDMATISQALEGNTAGFDDDPGQRPLGTVLLTGATGFLGVHILNNLLKSGTGEIYCLMRKGAFASLEAKLQGLYVYYFEDSIEEYIGSRIHCIEGDITDRVLVSALDRIPFDTLINCAACVKHFSNDDTLDQVNVRGVENLVELCCATGARLVHISTVSVAGEAQAGTPAAERILHENELYFGQILENRYIATKFESECVVLSAIERGLDAKIMRVGNLMPRRVDGEFQINSLTNGFMRQLRGYYALGCVPYAALAREFEFSPIDETAAAILSLAQTDARFTVFHANNTHRVFLADVVRAMRAAGLPLESVSAPVFAERLQTAMANAQTNDVVAGLIAYLGRNQTQFPLDYDNTFTRLVLNRLGVFWNTTDDAYMLASFEALEGLGFFDFDL